MCLEACESLAFDATRLSGLTPSLLHDLMKLTCIDDEKHAIHRLRTHSAQTPDTTDKLPSSKSSSENQSSKMLEQSLDEDIAKALAAESLENQDHNADKKLPRPGMPVEVDSSCADLSESTSSFLSSSLGQSHGSRSLSSSSDGRELAQQVQTQLSSICDVVEEEVQMAENLTNQVLGSVLQGALVGRRESSSESPGSQAGLRSTGVDGNRKYDHCQPRTGGAPYND